MRLSIRSRFFVSVLLIVVVSTVVAGIYLSSTIRQFIYERNESGLHANAQTARLMCEAVLTEVSFDAADELVRQLSAAMDVRVTLIREDGTVVGDSHVERRAIDAVDNHLQRPEVQMALNSEIGVSRRYSRTVKFEMMYVAIPVTIGQDKGFVRVARPLKEINQALFVLYGVLLMEGGIVLIITLLMSVFFSYQFSRVLRMMLDYAQRLADGQRSQQPIQPPTELGGLTHSLQRLSEQLEQSFSDLAEERNRFEAVLDGMSEGVIALDADQKTTVINRAALLLLGLGKAPLGRSLLETLRITELSRMVRSLVPGTTDAAEFTLEGMVPRIVYVRVGRMPSGAFVLVFMDVTELRRLESLRRDFVSNVSHELRTPISVVRANAETLLDGALDDEQAARRFLSSILVNSERLSRLVGDLLDLSRIEEGKMKLVKETIDVRSLFHRVVAGLDTRIGEKNQQVNVSVPDGLTLAADAGAMEQVLFNYLDNALKYSGEGTSVEVRAMANSEGVVIEVEDNGPGIAEHHRERLFERFYRVDRGRSRDVGGTGLGLSIVKHLVSAQGGTVGMRAAEGGGSVFWVRFPEP